MKHKQIISFIILSLIIATCLPFVLIGHVRVSTDTFRYANPDDVPEERVAIIFGAGVRRDGRPSRMLADRIQGGIALYESGRVNKLLMTGDNSRVEYNEVVAMQEYAIEQGVPEEDIVLDYAGFSTYESCYRANEIFGITQAVLVTQAYHLPRAVYTCRQLGVEAVGLGTPDWEVYPGVMIQYTMRESIATLNALLQVHVIRPEPTFLGQFEGI
ncbi:MAG: ElyC/SanA/YdcF family protein [Chloroflexota bacterium]